MCPRESILSIIWRKLISDLYVWNFHNEFHHSPARLKRTRYSGYTTFRHLNISSIYIRRLDAFYNFCFSSRLLYSILTAVKYCPHGHTEFCFISLTNVWSVSKTASFTNLLLDFYVRLLPTYHVFSTVCSRKLWVWIVMHKMKINSFSTDFFFIEHTVSQYPHINSLSLGAQWSFFPNIFIVLNWKEKSYQFCVKRIHEMLCVYSNWMLNSTIPHCRLKNVIFRIFD